MKRITSYLFSSLVSFFFAAQLLAYGETGYLKMTIVSARDLPAMDFFGKGKSDPYIKYHIKRVEGRTPVISDNLNPEWNHVSFFNLNNMANMLDAEIKLELKEDDVIGARDVGHLTIKLDSVTFDREVEYKITAHKGGALRSNKGAKEESGLTVKLEWLSERDFLNAQRAVK